MKRSVLPCWKLSILYKPAFQRLAAAIVSVCFFAAAVSVPAVAIETQGYTDVNPGNIWYEDIMEATEEDWGTEYLDYILSIKVVSSVDEAIAHINKYNTKHSEAIITNNYEHAQKFLDEVDAAAVYVNASTRFTDGFEFGFGAEIGISTQKLHARGPMGLLALTTTKYIIYGNGQVRP